MAARILALAGLLASLAGLVAAAVVLPSRPVREATRDGLTLRVEGSRWLEGHAGHADGAAHRLSVELTARAGESVTFDPGELRLVARERLAARSARVVPLRPGEQVRAVVEFEVPDEEGPVRLIWSRSDRPALLLASEIPAHEGPPDRWPRKVEELPRGDAVAGRRLFGETGCAACHGTDDIPATVGPALVGGRSAQYLYESILDPDAACAGETCAAPSTMPSYARRLDPREIADLIAFLLTR